MNRAKQTLTDLLQEQALDPSTSVKQLQQQLRSAGVDIDRIVRRANELVGARVREHYRDMAQKQKRKGLLEAAISHFETMPIAEVRSWLQWVAGGAAGPDAQIVAQPCFKNKSAEEMGEAELRNLAAEIRVTIESSDDGKSG
jgi:hypothetical protein